MSLPTRYTILRSLGAGSQGEVFLAVDRYRADSLVAVKLLRGPGALRGDDLRREFLTLTRLRHPNIARVRDFGETPERSTFFTTDYIGGGNLLDWVADSDARIRWPWLVQAAGQALSALAYLARRGVSHGDVKPANLLVESLGPDREGDSSLKLIDFGTARAAPRVAGKAGGPAYERSGTPAYLPPPDARAGRATGLRVDLYSLGMSLFHAAAGRLPFRLGDRESLEEWWRRKEPARLRDLEPEVPAVLDALVAHLTSLHRGDAFETAAEALEFLRNKVSLRSPRGYEGGPRIWLAAREGFLEGLLEGGLARAGRPQLVLGPPGSGKRTILEALVAHLQVRGYRAVLFRGRSDGAAYRELRSVAAEVSGSALSRHVATEEEPVDILYRLRSARVALLLSFDEEEVDEHGPRRSGASPPASRGHAFFETLARNLGAAGGDTRESLPFLCVATSQPDRLQGAMGVALDRFDHRHLEPLSRSAIEEVSREYFMVDSLPESVIARVARESDGHPAAALEALESLRAAGVRADSMGHLTIPTGLPERLVPEKLERFDVERLAGRTRRALGKLLVAREDLSAAQLAERFPSETETRWRSLLEDLHLKGFCRLVDDGVGPRFRVRRLLAGGVPSRLLNNSEEAEARAELSRYFSGLRVIHFEGRLAWLWNEIARGRLPEALSLATSLAATLLRRGREHDLTEMFTALWNAAGEALRTDRRLLALRLRAADAFLRRAEYDAALEALGGREPVALRWFRVHAQKLKAKVHEARGRRQEAIEELERLLERERNGARRAVGARSLLCCELEARLAPLLFQTGDAARGRACLETADEAFALCKRLPRGLRDLGGARVLSLFASSLAVHGDLRKSAAFLEESLRLLRDGGREDLLRTALNELGILYVRGRRWHDALEVFRESETLARRAGDRLSAMRATYNQAVTHYRLDDLSRAEELFHQARAISDDLGVHAFAPTIWLGFAGVLRERGRYLDAVRLYRRVLRTREEVRPDDTALARNNLAEIYLQLGRLGKSLHHSREAVRIAREIDNRSLLALTTCLHGVVHWALGQQTDARSLIEEAAAIARKQGDPRPAGFCHLSLGRLAASLGDTRRAIGHLRRAVAASRAAGDRAHLRLGMLELSSLLIEQGRPGTGRRWLPRLVRAQEESGFARARLSISILALKLEPDWPGSPSRLLALCRAARDRGDLWETFLVLRQELSGDGLSVDVQQVLAVEREAVLTRVVRRLPAELRPGFERFWRIAAAAPGSVSSARVVAGTTIGGRPTTPEGALDHLLQAGERDLLPVLLEEFRGFLGARILAVAELRPGGDPDAVHVAAGRSARSRVIRDLFDRAESLTRASVTGQLVRAEPYLLLRLPGERPPRVVCVEPDGSTDANGLARLSRAAGLLVACALELCESRAGLRGHAAALTEARAEIRRLNVLMTRSASELETALLTRRLEMREVQRQLETQGRRSRRPGRTPVGQSAAMRAILNRLPGIAEEKHPVLLLGESGVGKDLIARWIHELGPRRDLPYVAEVCNVSESLVEVELFGFEKGAFTDALEDRQGLFQRVAGGSIYLDEVTEISPRLQAKILRVLEAKRIRRVGGDESAPVDFRILASSRQPAKRLEDGVLLRRDLFYRLNAEVIEIPPLRDRPEDLPVLVDEILAELTSETGAPRPYVHPEVMTAWSRRPWPGNVRELENELQRLLLHSPHEITLDAIQRLDESRRTAGGSEPSQGPGSAASLLSLREAKLRTERELVLRALRLYGGNASQAAKALQVTRRHLGSLIDKHGIELQSIKRGVSAEPPPRRATRAGRDP